MARKGRSRGPVRHAEIFYYIGLWGPFVQGSAGKTAQNSGDFGVPALQADLSGGGERVLEGEGSFVKAAADDDAVDADGVEPFDIGYFLDAT